MIFLLFLITFNRLLSLWFLLSFAPFATDWLDTPRLVLGRIIDFGKFKFFAEFPNSFLFGILLYISLHDFIRTKSFFFFGKPRITIRQNNIGVVIWWCYLINVIDSWIPKRVLTVPIFLMTRTHLNPFHQPTKFRRVSIQTTQVWFVGT